jgi:hypothetical protein
MEYDGTFYGNLVYRTVITYILWPFGIFCGHLVYFVAIWYILWPFGIYCEYLATLPQSVTVFTSSAKICLPLITSAKVEQNSQFRIQI